jgi:hypothetical protein
MHFLPNQLPKITHGEPMNGVEDQFPKVILFQLALIGMYRFTKFGKRIFRR